MKFKLGDLVTHSAVPEELGGIAQVEGDGLYGVRYSNTPDKVEHRTPGTMLTLVPQECTDPRGIEVNPKEVQAATDNKAPLDYLEHAANVEICKAIKTGADKYGRRNFRDTPIKANVYIGAIMRHIGAYSNGEDLDPDSGLSHFAHIGACVHVVLSAMDAGTFTDDRVLFNDFDCPADNWTPPRID